MIQARRHLGAVATILTVLIITLVLSFLGLAIELTSKVSSGPFGSGQTIIANLIIVGTGLLVAMILFYFVLRGSLTVGARIAVSVFVFSAIMSLLLFVKLLLAMTGASSAALLVVVSLVAYVGSYLGVLAIFDVLSRRTRNALFAICSGVLGTFTGVVIPSPALVFVLLLMVVLDFGLMRRHTVEKTKKVLEDYERLVIMRLSYAGKNWAIGLADLLSYSMLIANSYVNVGLIASLVSLLLVVTGFFVGSRRAEERGQVAALPLAVGFGLIPLIIHIMI